MAFLSACTFDILPFPSNILYSLKFKNLFTLSALTSLSANINPDGYSTYEDGTPVKIQLALTFQELTPIYRRDYAEETNGTTIGY